MADEWSEEDIDEYEEEYVYRRDAPSAVALQLEDLVIRQNAPAQHSTAVKTHKPANQDIHLTHSNLPTGFAPEVAQLKDIEGVSLKMLTQGVQITIQLDHNASTGEVAIVFHALAGPNFPQDRLECKLLSSRALSAKDTRILHGLLTSITTRFPSAGALKAIVDAFKHWLQSPDYRAELVAQAECEEAEVAAAEAARKAKLEARLEAEEEAKWEQEKRTRIPPPWQPLSAADVEQHFITVGGALPCQALPNLDLPTAYSLASACVGNRMFIFGGKTDSGFSSDLFVFHLGTKRIECFPENKMLWPPALIGHAMVALGKAIFVFGGIEGASNHFSMYMWELNTDTLEWSRRQSSTPRAYLSATVLSDTKVVLFGGMNPRGEYCNNLLLFDLARDVLLLTAKSSVQPQARMGHCAVVYQNRLIVYSGHGVVHYPDVWVYDFPTANWYGPVATPDVDITARAYATAFLVGGSMIIYGGEYDDERVLNELLIYEIATARFYVKKLTHVLPERSHHTAVLNNGIMLVCGGGVKSLVKGWATRAHPVRYTNAMSTTSTPPPVMIALTPPTVVVPPSRLIRDLAALQRRPDGDSFCDLRLGPTAQPVHAWLLCTHAPELESAISAALATKSPLVIPGLKHPDSYTAFIDYLYTGNPFASCDVFGPLDIFAALNYTKEVREELCAAASELKLEPLTECTLQQCSADRDCTSTVVAVLAKAYDLQLFTDFTLVGPTKRFPVYKSLLACRSEYFRAMLSAGMAESTKGELTLSIDEVAAAALQRFFFTDKLDSECAESVIDLLAFADIAQLVRLQRLAEKLITAAYDLTDLDSVIALAAQAHLHRLHSLLSRCLLIIVQHFTVKAAAQSAAWATLSFELQEKLRKLTDE